MKIKAYMFLIIMFALIFIVRPIAAVNDPQILDQNRFSITLTVQDFYDIIIDGQELILDLGSETDTEKEILIRANMGLTVAINSVDGFGELNEYFQYILKIEDKENEGQYISHPFTPGTELPPDIVYFEPGENEFYLVIALTDEMTEQWSTVINSELQELNFDLLGEDWTELAAGEYTDILEITFSRM
ncbi:MAG: hypothetical protein ACOCUG_03615 [Halanaerobium sp.]